MSTNSERRMSVHHILHCCSDVNKITQSYAADMTIDTRVYIYTDYSIAAHFLNFSV